MRFDAELNEFGGRGFAASNFDISFSFGSSGAGNNTDLFAPIFARPSASTPDTIDFDQFRSTNVKNDDVNFDQFRSTTGTIVDYDVALFAALSGRELPYADGLIDIDSYNAVNGLIVADFWF